MKVRFYMVMSRIHYACTVSLFWLGRVTNSDRIKSYAARQGLNSMKASIKVVQSLAEEYNV